MLKLYENIKYYRKQKGMTQEYLAKLAGYTDRSSIAKIEKGLVDLPQSKIAQFAEIFGVSSSELMGWGEVKKKNDTMTDIVLRLRTDDVFLSVVEAAYEMEPEKLKGLLSLLK